MERLMHMKRSVNASVRPQEEIPVALIGCGMVGHKRAGAMPAQLTMVAAYDSDPVRNAEIARELGLVDCGSARTALSRATGGLAIIASPHSSLVELSLLALQCGCDVLVEKPAACTLADARSLQAAASATGRLVRVGYNHRFHPAVRKARSLIESGAVRDPFLAVGRYGHGGRPGYADEWRADAAIAGGGELIDQAPHLIDLARWLVGEMELEYAALPTLYWPMAVEDNAFLQLRLRSGGSVSLHASWTEWTNRFEFEVTGRLSKVVMRGLGGSYGTEELTYYQLPAEGRPPDSTTWRWPGSDDSWRLELEDVAVGLTGGRGVGADIEDALAVLEIIERARAESR